MAIANFPTSPITYGELNAEARERILRALLILAARGRAVLASRVDHLPDAIASSEGSHATGASA